MVVVMVAPHVPLRPRVGAAHLSPAPRGAAQRRRPVGRSAGDCVAVAAAAAAWNGAGEGKKVGRNEPRPASHRTLPWLSTLDALRYFL